MRFLKKKIKFAFLILCTVVFNLSCMSREESFNLTIDQLLDGSVPVISPEEARAMDVAPAIIDARSQAEFHVSHLAGAHHVDYDNFDPDNLPALSKDEPVRVLCTIGYRSEKIGERLQALGYNNVYNLYGGIIQWKNDGYEVVNQTGLPTDSVHGYSRAWGHWLKNGVAVYE